MLFNSFVFGGFFCAFYALYVCLFRKVRLQNFTLLVGSYLFYGWWDWRFLSLLAISTLCDYLIGIQLSATHRESVRKRLLGVSLFVNLGILALFKYFNFFAESTVDALNVFGLEASYPTLKFVLPVGVSFYTFQTMSYTIDVYRKKLEPTRSLLDFAVFVSFFPQLVAGPIERASRFLPQVAKPRKPSLKQFDAGLVLVMWGLYKKTVIADNMATIVNPIYNNYTGQTGLDLLLASLAFTLQIYCDFSGYTDIARGLAKMMGFELMLNFKLPYFAVNPSDFWQRWHVSLSSWLRDYLYISLGGNRGGALKTYRNLFLTMLLGGLWHGARWNFVIWGAFHGLILILYRRFDRNPINNAPFQQGRLKAMFQIAVMFCFTVVGWILFRCETFDQIVYIFSNIGIGRSAESFGYILKMGYFCWPLVLVQLVQYRTQNLSVIANNSVTYRWFFYTFLGLWILFFGVRETTEFLYFQF